MSVPTFGPFDGVAPDLRGNNEIGSADAFFSYPTPAKSVASTPASGGTVTGLIGISVQPPTPMAQNSWWQNLNEQLGCELQVNMVDLGEYSAKLATLVAGDELPDLVYMMGWALPPRLPSLLDAKFHDLSEYLSGDAVLDYPNIANLPTQTWKVAMANSGIYGVPVQVLQGEPMYVRRDVVEELGLEWNPRDADEVIEIAVEVSDPSINRYAFGLGADVFDRSSCAMFGAPFGWKEEGGSFTYAPETDEYRAALDWSAKLFASGAVHPDTYAGINAPEMFKSGTIVALNWGPGSFQGLLTSGIGMDLQFWAPPKAEGGGIGQVRIGPGVYGMVTVSKQESEERVQELLRVVDYMSAPFGSDEYLQMNYGLEGKHYTWDENHNPVATDLLAIEQPNSEFRALGGRQALYTAGFDDATQALYDYEQEAMPTGVRDASFGLYSETKDSRPELAGQISDVRNDVIRGRKSLEDFDAAVATWRSSGGDQMRAEYEEAFAVLNG